MFTARTESEVQEASAFDLLERGEVMTTGSDPGVANPGYVNEQLVFQKKLQDVINKAHGTTSMDEIMLEVSAEIRALMNAERALIYALGEDRQSLATKTRSGPDSLRDLKLAVGDDSIVGRVALTRRIVNVKDVYDDEELSAIGPGVRFQEIDRRAANRTRQMLVVPIVDTRSQALAGVLQLVNNRSGTPFDAQLEQRAMELAQTLAIALRQRRKLQQASTRYDSLIRDAVLSVREFELASRHARERAVHIEHVLVDEFRVKLPAIGRSAAKFFGVPYEPFKSDRAKPVELLKSLKREYVVANQWLPVEDSKEGLVVLCLDPEQIRRSGIVTQAFPNSRIVYRVTTRKEFDETIDQFYGIQAETPKRLLAAPRGMLESMIAQVVNEAYRSGNRERLLQETADLWRYSLILIRRHDLGLQDILTELHRRETVDKIARAGETSDADTEEP